ncbi:MAG: type II secretion system F family protein [Rhodospirillales bacterium]|nr:type II secretion system F family protein [Rhodospirillales bacterium]
MDAATIIMVLAFAGTLFSVLAAMSYFMPKGRMSDRLKGVASHRQDLAARQLSSLQQQRSMRPKTRPGLDFLNAVVERLKLKEKFDPKALRAQLARGGFRSSSATTIYIAATVGLPIVLAVFAYFYIKLVSPSLDTFRLLVAAAVAGAIGYYAPKLYVDNNAAKRQKILGRAFPDALDLLVICVEAGLSLEAALNRVTEEMAISAPLIAEEVGLLGAELAFLGDRRQAYENFAERTGLEAAKSLSTTLIQAERYGTSVAVGLRVLSQESRESRLAAAEKKAAALPAKLTVPMILFFLPVLFVVIAGPAGINISNN